MGERVEESRRRHAEALEMGGEQAQRFGYPLVPMCDAIPVPGGAVLRIGYA